VASSVVKCGATKQLLILAPPAVLTLHLKRFEQVGRNLRKLSCHVEFDELLDLAPFCSRLAFSQVLRLNRTSSLLLQWHSGWLAKM